MAKNIKSRFISYISQPVGEPETRKKATFKSYIDDEVNNSVEEEDPVHRSVTIPTEARNNMNDVQEAASEFFDMELSPGLLPGELALADIDGVLKFTPYSDRKQGSAGKLCVTTFKLTFITAERSSYEMPGRRQRNKILNEDDIPLSAIESIYHVTANGKRKRLPQGHQTSSITKRLEIHSKDFRIHTFGFNSKVDNIKFVNTLVHHAFPNKDKLLFAYEFSRSNPVAADRHFNCDTPLFDCIRDWQEELCRCQCDTKWRVAHINMAFDLSDSLPQYFVVPDCLENPTLKSAAPQFTHRRIPTWCYTHTNHNSLLRMSCFEESSGQPNIKQKLLSAVKLTGNQKNSPSIVDMAEECPSCKDVQESYSKLRKLCMSDTQRDFLRQDESWYSSIDDTKWLQYVAQCLSVSSDIARTIMHGKRAVVIQESSGCDFSCLVSSVVQILLDPHYRSQHGFQALIQKEWVKMGHPFQEYLVLVNQGEMEEVPIFLLFLDCVWQLLQQYPASFEFTETYLTTLWDTAHIGVFDTFLFNSDHQRWLFIKDTGRNIRSFRLPTAWKWESQFKTEDLSLFKNPLYVLTHDADLKASLNDISQLLLPGKRSQSLRHSDYRRQLGSQEMELPEEVSPDILTPVYSAANIRVWTQCFIRWQAPAQILSGGSPSLYLQQCHMVEEILQLHHKANLLEARTSSRGFRPRSDLIFGQTPNSPNLSNLLNSTYLTSSFPFSAGPTLQDQHMMSLASTINVYLRNSSLIDSDEVEETE